MFGLCVCVCVQYSDPQEHLPWQPATRSEAEKRKNCFFCATISTCRFYWKYYNISFKILFEISCPFHLSWNIGWAAMCSVIHEMKKPMYRYIWLFVALPFYRPRLIIQFESLLVNKRPHTFINFHMFSYGNFSARKYNIFYGK